jgi:hypothetical protein
VSSLSVRPGRLLGSRLRRLDHGPLHKRRRGAVPIDIAELQLPGTLVAAVVTGFIEAWLCIRVGGFVEALLSLSMSSVAIRRESEKKR